MLCTRPPWLPTWAFPERPREHDAHATMPPETHEQKHTHTLTERPRTGPGHPRAVKIHEGPRRPQSRFRGRIELQTGCHGACTILLCAACNIGQCQPQKYACTPFQGANDRLTPRQPLCGAVLEEPRQPTDPTSHQTNPMVLFKHAATCEPSQSKHSPRCAKTETQTAAPPQVRQQPKHVTNTSRYRFIIGSSGIFR